MTRLSIVHTTAYKYKKSVTRSYNEARLTPLSDAQQVVLESRLKVSPSQAAVGSYRDYWGSRVSTFDMQHRHGEMKVTAVSTVEVDRSASPPPSTSGLGWEEIKSEAITDAFSEWITPSQLTAIGKEIRKAVAGVTAGLEPGEAAPAVMEWMRANMEYVKGVTSVSTNAEQVWQQRKGVCQDLAHLGIAALRSLGIPARYVSGYIHPVPDAAVGETVAGQSHAWLEWWDGEWRSWDPTNHKPAGNLHVTVARGRDYRDVAPVRGILSGGGGSVLSVQVQITRLT
ncbi:transglutaminase family protein [Arthrobacter sp. efr-133-TYG-118]|jgi:transglutaminase-like putative cysteine protease|uniref:transglutaminase family protein n=1 Tax=Arthrobacter sp. efr-133-TYG-118 TaxID=3040279 RepID=UPI00254C8FE6|nr:transglutaminase family protein [Arthrobacter sp. efr-133-TYG-118]